jgi:thiamine-monophosphate kinase
VTDFLSEDSILTIIGRHFPDGHASLLLGRGDDAAVIRAGQSLCVSSDLFLEDVHFRRDYFTPEEIGHKALAVNISDMAACGARPLGFTLCLGLPPGTESGWLENFFSGMAALAEQHGLVLAGGDLSACSGVHIAITIWGEASGKGLVLRRGECLPGDILFIVGRPGLARVGLRALETRGRAAAALWPEACAAHLRPAPQISAALAMVSLADASRPPSVMDVSDGIARDLPRLLQGRRPERKFGATLRLEPAMLHPEVRRYALEHGLSPVTEALLGGEDYALLGACPPATVTKLQNSIPCFSVLGAVSGQPEITVNGEVFRTAGFDHFATG